jgi:integrase
MAQKRRTDGEGSLFLRGATWWLKAYLPDRPPIQKSTGVQETRRNWEQLLAAGTLNPPKAALDAARDIIARERNQAPLPREIATVTVGELLDDYLAYLEDRAKETQKRSVPEVAKYVHDVVLRPFFGGIRASRLTRADLNRFRKAREAKGISPHTVNRNLAQLRSALIRAAKTETGPKTYPWFEMTSEKSGVRQGFLVREGYEVLLAELPPSIRPLLITGYHIGIRRGELLKLTWDMVEQQRNVIAIPEWLGKKGARDVPIWGDMIQSLSAQRALRDRLYPAQSRVWFWHGRTGGHGERAGHPIVDFHDSWESAVARAHARAPELVPEGLLFHDLRRSAVRNMVHYVHLPESMAMRITGHTTRATFERYNIVGRREITLAADKLNTWWQQKEEPAPQPPKRRLAVVA